MFIGRKTAATAILTLSLSSASALFLPISAVLLTATDSHAETRYVKPRPEAAIRRGQGNEYKIIKMVKDGTPVELLEENDDYSLVRLDDGMEGWILKRYLSTDPPLTDMVTTLRQKNDELQQQQTGASQKVEAVSEQLAKTQNELQAVVRERDKIVADYQTLQHDTADVMKIHNDMENTAEENKKLTEKMAVMEKENANLKKDKTINWFLAGAGVLLLGVLLGRMPGPNRRRRQSLLS